MITVKKSKASYPVFDNSLESYINNLIVHKTDTLEPLKLYSKMHLMSLILFYTKKEIIIPASVVLHGEYGENDVAMGVPVKINQNGISEIQKIKLDGTESSSLKKIC